MSIFDTPLSKILVKYWQREKVVRKTIDWTSLILAASVSKEYGVPLPDWLKDMAAQAALEKEPKWRGPQGNPHKEAEQLWEDIRTWLFIQDAELNIPTKKGDRVLEHLTDHQNLTLNAIKGRKNIANAYLSTTIGDMIMREVIYPATQTKRFQQELTEFRDRIKSGRKSSSS